MSDEALQARAAQLLATRGSAPLPPKPSGSRFMQHASYPVEVRRRLLERGVAVWGVRVEGEPRPYDETGSDAFTVGFVHPRSGQVELRRFSTSWKHETEGMTLLVPLLVDGDDALPFSFLCVEQPVLWVHLTRWEDDGEPPLTAPRAFATERVTFGRGAECDVVIRSGRVSRLHFSVVRVGDAFFVEDSGATDGTWVRDVAGAQSRKIHRAEVSDGCEVILAPCSFVLRTRSS